MDVSQQALQVGQIVDLVVQVSFPVYVFVWGIGIAVRIFYNR